MSKASYMNNFINNNGTLAPYDTRSKIYVGSSVNQQFLNLLNPYHHFSWSKVTINVEKPVFPTFDEMYRGTNMTKEEYDNLTYYDLNIFTQGWGMAWKELIECEESILYPMFLDLVNEAKSYIRFNWINDYNKWKKLVSLYIAHYMEIFVETLKDEHNDRSFNARVTDENEHRKIEIAQKLMEDFDTTIYGRLFKQEYIRTVKYINPMWGLIEDDTDY